MNESLLLLSWRSKPSSQFGSGKEELVYKGMLFKLTLILPK